MNDADSQFRVVLRGYDPAQVSRRLEELVTALGQTAAQRDDVIAQLEKLEAERAKESEGRAAPEPLGPPTFEHLGARVGQILKLAEEESTDLRRQADDDIAAKRAEHDALVTKTRDETDRYATDKRSHADTEAARILEDARRAADDKLDGAERDAAARIQEADALFEEQRAKAVQSAADFESTLAARRKAAEEEFTRQMGEVERRLAEAKQTLEEAQAAAEATRKGANTEAAGTLRTAEERAKTILDEARTKADRVRAESDRELVAATQRRDAINAQLGNVRQMLATLTGSVAALNPFEGEEAAAVAQATEEAEVADDAEADVAAAAEDSPAEASETDVEEGESSVTSEAER